jgi:hypothetical protein
MNYDLHRCCTPEELAHYAGLGLVLAPAEVVEHIDAERVRWADECRTAYDDGFDDGKAYILRDLLDDIAFEHVTTLEQLHSLLLTQLDGLS